MNLFTKLLTNVAGGAGALALDEARPNWTKRVGASAPSPSNPAGSPGVAVTPGAMAAVAGVVALALMPAATGGTAKTVMSVASNLVAGAFVVEGAKLAQDNILPLLRPKPVAPVVPGGVVAPMMYGVAGRPGLPNYGPMPVPQHQLEHMLQNHRRRAA